METLSRRCFIQAALGAASVGPAVARASQDNARAIAGKLASPFDSLALAQGRRVEVSPRDASFNGPLCVFSKDLPRMNGRELGRSLKALGFEGVDLTVRPGGHVDPKRVAIELPVFVDGIRVEGFFFQAEDGIRDVAVTGVQTCALPI